MTAWPRWIRTSGSFGAIDNALRRTGSASAGRSRELYAAPSRSSARTSARVDLDRFLQIGNCFRGASHPVQQPRPVYSGSREPWIEARGLGEGFQRFLGTFAPGEQREVVMPERIVRVFLNICGEFLRPFRHSRFDVPTDKGPVAPGGVIAGLEAKVVVVSEGGVPVISARLGGSRERQRNVRALRSELPRLGEIEDRAGIVLHARR